MIHEIHPSVFRNNYLNAEPKNTDIALIYDSNNIFLKKVNDTIILPKISDINNDNNSFDYKFLFEINNTNFFLVEPNIITNLDNFNFYNVSILRNSLPEYLSFASITGYQLSDWYNKNNYCGSCGTKLYHSSNSRSMVCPKCNNVIYPFLAPAVIVGIINKDKILVTAQVNIKLNKYALVAGYTEIGESIEETVAREVEEEVGLKVKNIKYYKSQPWSFSSTLLFGFFCELDGSDEITLDEEELSLAKWITKEEIKEEDNPISLTGEMLQIFRKS